MLRLPEYVSSRRTPPSRSEKRVPPYTTVTAAPRFASWSFVEYPSCARTDMGQPTIMQNGTIHDAVTFKSVSCRH